MYLHNFKKKINEIYNDISNFNNNKFLKDQYILSIYIK